MFRKLFLPALAALAILTVTSCSESQEPKGDSGDMTTDNDPGADSVLTPFGWFHKDHVHEHPAGSVITKNEDGTTTITYPDGNEKTLTEVESPEVKQPNPSAPSTTGLPIRHAYLNWANFHTKSGVEVGTFNANYIVPGTPTVANGGQTLYYFTGLVDSNSTKKTHTILQPVLGFYGGSWHLTSYNCCPSGQVPHANVVTGMAPGDTVFTSMVRSGSSYTITATWNSQSSALTVKTGNEYFNWPNTSLEVYDLDTCSETAVGPMTFFDLVMLDTSGKAISMDWGIIGDNSACNTELTLVDSTTTTIQQK